MPHWGNGVEEKHEGKAKSTMLGNAWVQGYSGELKAPDPIMPSWALRPSISFCCLLRRAASDRTSLTVALLTTLLARLANLRVLWLSSVWMAAGVMLQMIAVLAFPPSDGWRILVSLESR